MATHTLLTAATDLSQAASWSSGVAPSGWTNGDSVSIPDGTEPVTNLSALSGVELDDVFIGPECRRQFGGVSGSLVLDFSHSGGSFNRLRYYGAGVALIDATGDLVDLRGRGDITLTGGDVGAIRVARGVSLHVGESCAVANIIRAPNSYTYVEKNDGSTAALTLVEHAGGRMVCKRSVATLNISGALAVGGPFADSRFELRGDAAITTKVNVRGGSYNHASSGAIADLFVATGAEIDPTGAKTDITVTAATIMEGARIKQQHSGIGFSFPDDLTTIGDIGGLTTTI